MTVMQDNQIGVLLRDPLQLADKHIIIPEGIVPLLTLLDGTRENAGAICASLALRYGMEIPADLIQQLLDALDETLLLENDNSRQAALRATDLFRELPFRIPIHAGNSYPEKLEDLRDMLDNYLASVDEQDASSDLSARGGILSPHIDYERGGTTYAKVWKRAMGMARAADLAVILGTDHHGEEPITLTTQNYATPYGVLPTATAIVDTIAAAIGPDKAFSGELRHRTEHSIELASVWLHHVRGGQPIEMVPILCGSFRKFTQDGVSPQVDETIQAAIDAIHKSTVGAKTLFIAAGDLAHVGPVFDGEPVDLSGRALLRHYDDELLTRICAGDSEGFIQTIQGVKDKNNVCGVPPIYMLLKLVGPAKGDRAGYDQCPADKEGTSLVSIGGVVLGSL